MTTNVKTYHLELYPGDHAPYGIDMRDSAGDCLESTRDLDYATEQANALHDPAWPAMRFIGVVDASGSRVYDTREYAKNM
jgi:hypothetical protein